MSDDTLAPTKPSDKAPELTGPLPTTGIEDFLEKHGKKTAIAIIVAVLGAGLYFFIRTKKEDSRREAGEAFASAVTRGDLEAVAERYAGTVSGGNALLALADRQFRANLTKEAHTTLTKFVNAHAGDPLYFNGVFALACIDENLGNKDAALAGFQKVASAGDEAIAGAAAALRVADLLLEKGEFEKAKDAYESLGARFPGSPFIEDADSRLLLVEQKIILRDNPAPEPEPEPEPAPIDPAPAPTDPAPAPTDPAPVPTDPAPAPTDPAPAPTDPAPVPTDPAPAPTDPAPAPTDPAPAPTDPAPAPTDPAPAPTDPAPAPTDPAPAPTDPAPAPTDPVPAPTDPAPAPAPAPAPTDPVPAPADPASGAPSLEQ